MSSTEEFGRVRNAVAIEPEITTPNMIRVHIEKAIKNGERTNTLVEETMNRMGIFGGCKADQREHEINCEGLSCRICEVERFKQQLFQSIFADFCQEMALTLMSNKG